MKYYFFSLLAISTFFFAACNGCGQNGQTTNADGTTTQQPVDNTPPSKDLIAQMEADITQMQGLMPAFEATNNEVMGLRKEMKSALAAPTESTKAQITEIYNTVTSFTTAYGEFRAMTGKLISLSADCSSGKVNAANAQKEYDSIKKMLMTDVELVTKAKSEFPGLKARYEEIFSSANKKAAGGK